MKKSILFFLFALLLLACQDATYTEPAGKPESETSVFPFSEGEIVKGRMRIKLKEEPVGEVGVRCSIRRLGIMFFMMMKKYSVNNFGK